jgi:uncharacterized protein YecE (DUF72 family)
MDFGNIEYRGIENSYFDLPNIKKYFEHVTIKNAKIYVGLSKWGRKEWVGTLYPKGTRDTEFIDNYVHHFNCIELNATHYKINTPAEIKKWADKAKNLHFKFCPKVPQLISHYSKFRNTDQLTTAFLEGILAFGEHLGPVFLQVSDKYTPTQRDIFFQYIQSLPVNLQMFIEVRHPDWFSDKKVMAELIQVLKEANKGFVITDTPGRRDAVHMKMTIPKLFIRFACNGENPQDIYRIAQWKNIIEGKGYEEAYFMLHVFNERNSIDVARYIQKEVGYLKN